MRTSIHHLTPCEMQALTLSVSLCYCPVPLFKLPCSGVQCPNTWEEVNRSILMNAEVKHRRVGPFTHGFKRVYAWNGKSFAPTLYSTGQSSLPLSHLS